MTDRLDALLRDVIHNLAAEGDRVRPRERDRRLFALDASDRGHQQRGRRRASLVGVVVVVLALAFGVPYGLSPTRDDGRVVNPGASPTDDVVIGPDGVTTHLITDRSRPIELVDGWYVLGNKWVLDWSKQTYRRVGGDGVQVSPNGRWVGAWVENGCSRSRYRILDLTTGTARNYDTGPNCDPDTVDPQFSPDGDRLVFTRPPLGEPALRKLVARVLDVGTWQTTTIMLDVSGLTCAEVACQLTWLPSGAELAITLAHKGGEFQPSVPYGIQTFTLDGSRARSLPIAGTLTGPGSWSPDGRFVVVRGVSGVGQIVEVATGTVVRQMAGIFLQATWVDNDHVLVWELDLSKIDNQAAVVTLEARDGLRLQRWRPPADVTDVRGPFPAGPLAAKLSQ